MEIKRFIGGILEANGYVLSDPQTGTCWIVDPGYKPKVFIQYVKQQELQPLGILLTHHHSDHTGAAEQLRKLDLNTLTPIEAMNFLYQLKQKL